MKPFKTLIFAAALAAVPSLATATDFLETSGPVYSPEPAFTWSGLYAGGLGGMYFEGGERAFTASKVIGFNVVNGQLLFGAEVEALGGFGWTGGGPSTFAVFSGRGRLGLLASDDVLVYGSVGFDRFTTSPTTNVHVGAGTEFVVSDHATARFDLEGLAYGGSFFGAMARGGMVWHFN